MEDGIKKILTVNGNYIWIEKSGDFYLVYKSEWRARNVMASFYLMLFKYTQEDLRTAYEIEFMSK